MKVLIAVSSKEFSAPTLSAGMKISQSFKATATIVDVGDKINDFSLKEVSMAQERMESWDFDRPGVDVLEWAFEYVKSFSPTSRVMVEEFLEGQQYSTESVIMGKKSKVTVCE